MRYHIFYLFQTEVEDNVGDCMLLPDYLPNNVTTKCFDMLRDDKTHHKVDKVVVIIHGYLKTFTSSTWMHEFRRHIQEGEPGAAVIVSVVLLLLLLLLLFQEVR